MRAMNSDSVHLIATDPPFNKNKDFHATPDSLARGASFQDRWSWENDVHQEWVDQITDDFPDVMNVIQGSRSSYGDDMGAFLCFMAVRLLEMHRVLRNDGSLYLHCDPTASHYLKELLDSIFGRKNFCNEIIWSYRRWTAGNRHFQRMHDTIFRYSKTNDFIFNLQYEPYGDWIKKDYGYVDPDTGKRWRWHTVKGNRYKVWLEDENRGVKLNDVWQIPYLGSTAKERTGFPTQKPLALYERIINASSNAGDIVFDPFAGCATTCVAAERLGRQWIGIDIWKKAEEVVIDRLEKEGLFAPKFTRRTKESRQTYMFAEDLHFTSEPPVRTDEGEEAAPPMKTKIKFHEPPGPKMSRSKMKSLLIQRFQSRCMGCGRTFDDERYLELDHNNPRSLGGINSISNRILLCAPCNKIKSNKLTLAGLWMENKRQKYMFDPEVMKIKFT